MSPNIQIKNTKERINKLKKEINILLNKNQDKHVKDSLYKLDLKYDTITSVEDINFEELRTIEYEIVDLYNHLLKLENDSCYRDISELSMQLEQIQKELDDANQILKSLRNGSNTKTKEELVNAFSNSINKQKTKFTKDVRTYSISYITTVILFSILLILSFFITNIQNLSWYSMWGIRVSIILPALAIINFIYFNYKLSKIQLIRFSHVHDLIDCGYEYIRFVLNDEQIISDYMKRILDNFLELKELSIIVRDEKNPAGKYFKEILSAFKGIKTNLGKK